MTVRTPSVKLLAPRRLCHVNLYVGDWERSLRFYREVFGFEEVFREPEIKAGFLSNGNTHHDVGLMEISKRERIGRGGYVQSKAGEGAEIGFNHFGLEMENELELVEGYRRLKAAGIPMERLTDSDGLSKSIYLRDPEGNQLQFYADSTKDWRGFWNLGARLITGPWNPEEGTPSREANYTVDPEIRVNANAVFPVLRITGGTLAVREFDRAVRFYSEVAGLHELFRTPDNTYALMTARGINRDLALVKASATRPPGLVHFSFQVRGIDELVAGARRLAASGRIPFRALDHGLKKSVYLTDPDGFTIEVYADIVPNWSELRSGDYPDAHQLVHGTSWSVR